MNTKSMTHEQISAFADGEMDDACDDVVLAALHIEEGREVWDVYHQIGDVLRSDEMAFALRPDFSARMSARLDMEPSIVAPAFSQARQKSVAPVAARRPVKIGFRRLAIPGAAAVAVATAAFFTAPQIMVALNGKAESRLAVAQVSELNSSQAALVSLNSSDGVIFRDPRIDGYLLAHQRFSPSVYSTAQYARSATFSNESNK